MKTLQASGKARSIASLLVAMTLLAALPRTAAAGPAAEKPPLLAEWSILDDFGRDLGRATAAGVVAPAAWAAQGLNGRRKVLSLQAGLSARTSVVYERAGLAPSAAPMLPGLPPQQVTKLGIEFRPATVKSQAPLGALRMQLAGNSTLLLKPRSGGLSVSWRQQF